MNLISPINPLPILIPLPAAPYANFFLSIMIRLILQYSHGTVKLFGKDQSDNLMGKSHFRERNLVVGPLVYSFRKTISATNKKDKLPGTFIHLFLDEVSEAE